jgi:hypothetical protein
MAGLSTGWRSQTHRWSRGSDTPLVKYGVGQGDSAVGAEREDGSGLHHDRAKWKGETDSASSGNTVANRTQGDHVNMTPSGSFQRTGWCDAMLSSHKALQRVRCFCLD